MTFLVLKNVKDIPNKLMIPSPEIVLLRHIQLSRENFFPLKKKKRKNKNIISKLNKQNNAFCSISYYPTTKAYSTEQIKWSYYMQVWWVFNISNVINLKLLYFQMEGSEIVVEGPRCSLRSRKVCIIEYMISIHFIIGRV